MQPVLQLKNICKRFPGVIALENVDFEVVPGEIHALLGENGAGKSTLIKVMTGAYPMDGGTITLAGKPVSPRDPAHAQAIGISPVYQEVNLLPNLSVAHNLFLGREPSRFGFIQWREIYRRAEEVLEKYSLKIDVRRSLSSYSIAIQQLVAIARGVDSSAKLLILDEPTASLDATEVAVLFKILRELRSKGISVIFVTHFLDQVYAICDRITVLRNGTRVGTFEAETLPRAQLIAHMLGRELQEIESKKPCTPIKSADKPALQVDNLAARNGVRNVSFSVSEGEAIGLAGLLGSGRTEICQALFGLVEKTSGRTLIHNEEKVFNRPADAIKAGLALCPEDRKVEGIIGPLSIRENLVLALQARRGWWRPIPLAEQKQLAQTAISDLRIACPHAEKPIGELSGGNQQKVILARWLCTQPKILILDEPTRGIDIGAHAEIIKLIRKLCSQGLTLVVASSEIEELVAFVDKVLVMRDKVQVASLTGDDISEESIVAAIAESTH